MCAEDHWNYHPSSIIIRRNWMVNGPRLTWMFSFPFTVTTQHHTPYCLSYRREVCSSSLRELTLRAQSLHFATLYHQSPTRSTNINPFNFTEHLPVCLPPPQYHYENIIPSTPALLQPTWNWRATSDASQRTPPLLFSLTMPAGSQQAIDSHTGYPKTVYTWFPDKYYMSPGLFRDKSLGEKHEGVQISSFFIIWFHLHFFFITPFSFSLSFYSFKKQKIVQIHAYLE